MALSHNPSPHLPIASAGTTPSPTLCSSSLQSVPTEGIVSFKMIHQITQSLLKTELTVKLRINCKFLVYWLPRNLKPGRG